MRSRRACAMLLVPLAVLATACGGGSSGGASSTGGAGGSTAGTGAPGQVIDIPISDSGFLFTKTSATASAGVVTLRAVNPQSVAHDISIKGNGVDAQGNQVSNGGVSQVTATLTPGTYEYYCSVPGHEQAGMKGTLTVS
jgi:uncharacterized cupredoxin-like copper-binding protein